MQKKWNAMDTGNMWLISKKNKIKGLFYSRKRERRIHKCQEES